MTRWPFYHANAAQALVRHQMHAVCQDVGLMLSCLRMQIFCSFGVDTLEALASTCTLYAVGDRQRCEPRPGLAAALDMLTSCDCALFAMGTISHVNVTQVCAHSCWQCEACNRCCPTCVGACSRQ